jgi:hypothetical protein
MWLKQDESKVDNSFEVLVKVGKKNEVVQSRGHHQNYQPECIFHEDC